MGRYTIELRGKLPPPHGVGPRDIAGTITIGPVSEAIHAGDLELKSIHWLHLIDKAGSMTSVDVVNPGTYDNYASVTFWRLTTVNVGTTPTTVLTRVTITSGSKTWRFLARGE
jgi:hypothetical protein